VKTIHLAKGLDLPADEAATQRYALVGLPGMGKSNAAGVLIEALLDHKEQVIVLDPASIHWSFRLEADGKTPAYNIVVMGGDHGDIPLTPTSGKLVAETLAGSNTSAVIDLSDFTIGDQRRFVTDFAEAFFHAKKRNRSPVMVVLEEAHEFIPQQVGTDQARMFGALKRANKIGRNYGIGWTYMDHRPQELNKAVLNLVSNLFVFGMSGKHERKAITDWLVESEVGGHDKLEAQLATLPIGTAQVWSPRWLKVDGQFQFPLKRTYDAGKTPVRGQSVVSLKPINVAALAKAMGEIETAAKQNDPKALQRRIADLEGQLKARPPTAHVAAPVKIVEKEKIVYALVREDFAAMDGLVAEVDKQAAILIQTAHAAASALESLKRTVPKRPKLQLVGVDRAVVPAPVIARGGDPNTQLLPSHWDRREDLNGGWPSEFVGKMKDIVIALRSWYPRTLAKNQLALLVGMAAGGGGFNNYLGKLRTLDVINGQGDELALTGFGMSLVANPQSAVTADDILDLWRPQLPSKAFDMIMFLRRAGGADITKGELAAGVAMDPNGGGFNNYLGKLRTAGLIEPRGLQLTELLR
jgi:hypothetical protein